MSGIQLTKVVFLFCFVVHSLNQYILLHIKYLITKRIGRAIESCSDRLDEECIAYGKAASSEEERTSLLNNVLSTNTDTSFALDDNHHVEEDSAISR